MEASFLNDLRSCNQCSFREGGPPCIPAFVEGPVPILLIGENPSWAEGVVYPFAENTISGKALDDYYLAPLGLTRSQVWITDLVKCRYPKHIYHNKAHLQKEIQEAAEICAREWLVKEIAVARPKIVVTLSNVEVYQRVRKIFRWKVPALFEVAVGHGYPVGMGKQAFTLFPMIHPDISRPVREGDQRKVTARRKWASIHMEKHIPALLGLLDDYF